MSSATKSQLLKSVAPAQLELSFDLPSQPLPGHEPLLTIAEACGVFNLTVTQL
jgi:hypothetical protein